MLLVFIPVNEVSCVHSFVHMCIICTAFQVFSVSLRKQDTEVKQIAKASLSYDYNKLN